MIKTEIEVTATPEEVWHAWTTAEGIRTFFAPKCNVDLRVGGPYEIYFNPKAKPGERGSDGSVVIAFEPLVMLSFTWPPPPDLNNRFQFTHVTVYIKRLGNFKSRVIITNDGFGESLEWKTAKQYFTIAWSKIVLPRLKRSFEVGPIDWSDPWRPADLTN